MQVLTFLVVSILHGVGNHGSSQWYDIVHFKYNLVVRFKNMVVLTFLVVSILHGVRNHGSPQWYDIVYPL